MINAILDRLDDWLNPIVVKELRQAVKSRMVIGILMLFLAIQLFALGGIMLTRDSDANGGVNWNAGIDVFAAQQGVLLWTIAIFVPAYTAVRFGAERSDQNVDLMFISTLRPASIIWGKFFAGFVLGMLVYGICAPFMTLSYLLRGIDIPTILAALAIDFLAMVHGIMAALLLSAVPGNRAVKFGVSFPGFIWLITCAIWATMGTMALIFEGNGEFFDVVTRYWFNTLLVVLGVFAVTLLMFFYAVALISPPTANRMLPTRVYLLTVWLLGFGGCLLSGYLSSAPAAAGPGGFGRVGGLEAIIPVIVFGWVFLPILLLQLAISFCERDEWGPRVARHIPRNPLARLGAFFLFTGAAGGILLTGGMIAATIGVSSWWLSVNGNPFPGDGIEVILLRFAVLAAYVYCYGMSAILVRVYLMGDLIRPAFTWLIMLLLAGLGSSIPGVIALVFFSGAGRGGEIAWYMLPNPFSIMDISRNGNLVGGYTEMCLVFLTTWGVAVTLLCIPWMTRQMRRFRPLQIRRPDPLTPIVLGPATQGGAG